MTKGHSDVYRVEKLIARRGKGSKIEYLVKWKNWSEKHNTWEPERNILDERLIDAFLKSEYNKHRDTSPSKSSKKSEICVSHTEPPVIEPEGLFERINTENKSIAPGALHNAGPIIGEMVHPLQELQIPLSCAPIVACGHLDSPLDAHSGSSYVGAFGTATCSTSSSPSSQVGAVTTTNVMSPAAMQPVECEQECVFEELFLPSNKQTTTLEKDLSSFRDSGFRKTNIYFSPDADSEKPATSPINEGDWISDRRLRKTTIIVATASSAAAKMAADVARSRQVAKEQKAAMQQISQLSPYQQISQQAYCLDHQHQKLESRQTLPVCSLSSTTKSITSVSPSEERPKLKVTISMDRIINAVKSSTDTSCPAMDSSEESANTSLENSDSFEEGKSPKYASSNLFKCPIEVMRRSDTSDEKHDHFLYSGVESTIEIKEYNKNTNGSKDGSTFSTMSTDITNSHTFTMSSKRALSPLDAYSKFDSCEAVRSQQNFITGTKQSHSTSCSPLRITALSSTPSLLFTADRSDGSRTPVMSDQSACGSDSKQLSQKRHHHRSKRRDVSKKKRRKDGFSAVQQNISNQNVHQSRLDYRHQRLLNGDSLSTVQNESGFAKLPISADVVTRNRHRSGSTTSCLSTASSCISEQCMDIDIHDSVYTKTTEIAPIISQPRLAPLRIQLSGGRPGVVSDGTCTTTNTPDSAIHSLSSGSGAKKFPGLSMSGNISNSTIFSSNSSTCSTGGGFSCNREQFAHVKHLASLGSRNKLDVNSNSTRQTSVLQSINKSYNQPIVNQQCATTAQSHDHSVGFTCPTGLVFLPPPDAKKLRLVQEISVTDVTVDGLTISIKECSNPKDFFGVPTNQLVVPVNSSVHAAIVESNSSRIRESLRYLHKNSTPLACLNESNLIEGKQISRMNLNAGFNANPNFKAQEQSCKRDRDRDFSFQLSGDFEKTNTTRSIAPVSGGNISAESAKPTEAGFVAPNKGNSRSVCLELQQQFAKTSIPSNPTLRSSSQTSLSSTKKSFQPSLKLSDENSVSVSCIQHRSVELRDFNSTVAQTKGSLAETPSVTSVPTETSANTSLSSIERLSVIEEEVSQELLNQSVLNQSDRPVSLTEEHREMTTNCATYSNNGNATDNCATNVIIESSDNKENDQSDKKVESATPTSTSIEKDSVSQTQPLGVLRIRTEDLCLENLSSANFLELDKPASDSKYRINEDDAANSSADFVLKATETVLRSSAFSSPSSPGILMSPSRSSTPVKTPNQQPKVNDNQTSEEAKAYTKFKCDLVCQSSNTLKVIEKDTCLKACNSSNNMVALVSSGNSENDPNHKTTAMPPVRLKLKLPVVMSHTSQSSSMLNAHNNTKSVYVNNITCSSINVIAPSMPSVSHVVTSSASNIASASPGATVGVPARTAGIVPKLTIRRKRTAKEKCITSSNSCSIASSIASSTRSSGISNTLSMHSSTAGVRQVPNSLLGNTSKRDETSAVAASIYAFSEESPTRTILPPLFVSDVRQSILNRNSPSVVSTNEQPQRAVSLSSSLLPVPTTPIFSSSAFPTSLSFPSYTSSAGVFPSLSTSTKSVCQIPTVTVKSEYISTQCNTAIVDQVAQNPSMAYNTPTSMVSSSSMSAPSLPVDNQNFIYLKQLLENLQFQRLQQQEQCQNTPPQLTAPSLSTCLAPSSSSATLPGEFNDKDSSIFQTTQMSCPSLSIPLSMLLPLSTNMSGYQQNAPLHLDVMRSSCTDFVNASTVLSTGTGNLLPVSSLQWTDGEGLGGNLPSNSLIKNPTIQGSINLTAPPAQIPQLQQQALFFPQSTSLPMHQDRISGTSLPHSTSFVPEVTNNDLLVHKSNILTVHGLSSLMPSLSSSSCSGLGNSEFNALSSFTPFGSTVDPRIHLPVLIGQSTELAPIENKTNFIPLINNQQIGVCASNPGNIVPPISTNISYNDQIQAALLAAASVTSNAGTLSQNNMLMTSQLCEITGLPGQTAGQPLPIMPSSIASGTNSILSARDVSSIFNQSLLQCSLSASSCPVNTTNFIAPFYTTSNTLVEGFNHGQIPTGALFDHAPVVPNLNVSTTLMQPESYPSANSSFINDDLPIDLSAKR